MAAPDLVNLSSLIDDAKCFALVRQQRWPEGVRCPGCGSSAVVRHGCDDTQPHRQRYRCKTCAGRFVCDAWGIGDGWDARELLRITRRLHGSADAVREASALPGEYQKLMHGLLPKTVPELVISVTPMPGVQVRYLKQVHPTEVELLPDSAEGDNERDDGTLRFVTRAWGDETRAYQLCLSADPADRPREEDLQLAVVALDVPGGDDVRLPPLRPCVVHWTDNQALSDMTDVGVEYFERHHRLGQALESATDAFRRGERDQSEQWLGEAVRLAHEMGATPMLDRLEGVVEIIDPAAGRVRLRPDVTAADFEGLIIASSHSTYDPTSPSDGEPSTLGPTRATTACPKCQLKASATDRFCRSCGKPLRERP
jgi:hypothetical protein